jgi:hypothetical protein
MDVTSLQATSSTEKREVEFPVVEDSCEEVEDA